MSEGSTPAQQLKQIEAELAAGHAVPSITTRQFLAWFGAQRRGSWVVWRIRRALVEAGLRTRPDFESAYIDGNLTFLRLEKPADAKKKEGAKASVTIAPAEEQEISAPPPNVPTSPAYQDPTYRVSKLAAANNGVTSVKPDSSIEHVVTLLMQNDFSQMPVMTNERDVKGVISWSSIGSRMALVDRKPFARDYMESPFEVRSSTSIFDALPVIITRDYVLVRADDNRILGIITASDLSEQFRVLSEPFLLLSEAENLLRGLIDGRFTIDELKQVGVEDASTRTVEGVADLTLGEYIRLLENPDRWAKFAVAIDRVAFCSSLDRIRRIRNDVMHFDPDGVTPSDLDALREFTAFLKRLTSLVR